MAETKKDAVKAFEAFVETYQVKYQKAAIASARTAMRCWRSTTSPPSTWKHLRTTNPIERVLVVGRRACCRRWSAARFAQQQQQG